MLRAALACLAAGLILSPAKTMDLSALNLPSTELMAKIEENLMAKVINSTRETAGIFSNEKTVSEIVKIMMRMKLKMADSVKGDPCLKFMMSDDAFCSVEFKFPRLSSILSSVTKLMAKVNSCPTLMRAFTPLVANPCTCERVLISAACPPRMHDVFKIVRVLC